MPRIRLTERRIPSLRGRPASSNSKEPVAYWDLTMPGFGVLVSSKTNIKSYIAQRDLPNGKTRRVTIGLVGTEIRTLDEAREKAADVIHGMRHGVDPRLARRGGVATLEQTALAYVDSHPNLAEKTKANYCGTLTYLDDWRGLRLTEITPAMIETRHRHLGEQRGEALANSVMRAVRAWYNDAIDRHPEVAQMGNPVRLRRKWYKIARRERHVSADELPKFVAAVMKLENPIARDYIRLLLFTGLRRLEAASLTWTDIDFTAKVIRLPANRTKPGRRLDLPMSDLVHKMLKERRELGDAHFVFPAHGTRGHISEPKFHFRMIAEATGIEVSPHDLRRTFAKAAVAAGIHTLQLKALLNHAVGENGDVTVGYVVLDENDLRDPAQKVADQLKKWSRIK
jgi:integrase